MNQITEIQALQNFATKLNLTVHEKYFDDKRKKAKKYFVNSPDGRKTFSPVLDYEGINNFLLGWWNALKNNS